MPGSKADITHDQLREMVAALGRVWLVRLVPTIGMGRVKSMHYTGAQLIRATGYLRHENRNGSHVYGRPATNRHVLVDDVHADALDALAADGLHPAVVVETSEGLFHAWITLSKDDLSDPVAAAAARILANRYGGDPHSAKAYQLGRLPGFTNRKDQHERHGQYPFTKVARRVRPGVPKGATPLLDAAEDMASRAPDDRQCAAAAITSRGVTAPGDAMPPSDALDIYDQCAKEAYMRHGTSAYANDRSGLDFAVACSLIGSGFDEQDAATVLMYGSDKAATRGGDYVLLTVRNACQRVAELRCAQ